MYEDDAYVKVYDYSKYGEGKQYALKIHTGVQEADLDSNNKSNASETESFDDKSVDDVDEEDDFEEDIAVEELGRGKTTRCIVYAGEVTHTRMNRVSKVQLSAL